MPTMYYLWNSLPSDIQNTEGRVRRYLSRKAATMLANVLVSSKLDYCNSLLSGITSKDLCQLQLTQNTLCRVVCRLP